jgi:hypothetical protein
MPGTKKCAYEPVSTEHPPQLGESEEGNKHDKQQNR